MEESISVAVRWRPFQQISGEKMDLQKIHDTAMGIGDSTFVFDQIMDNWSQAEVYAALVKPMVDKAVDGFDSTVLAYGQTGSGKTYTMGFENNENSEERGIIMRVLEDLFSNANVSDTKVSISFIEIYNEKVYDLLADNPTESIPAKGHKTSTATKKRVYDVADAVQIMSSCRKNRRVRPTKMNPNSSRSHAILTVYVAVKHGDAGERKAALHLVDLAGSEGVRRTSHSGIALKEGNHINQGLLCVAKVIKALSTKAKVIPYRDTTLTSALQDSLNLNSYLTMLACVSPYKRDFNETMSTLRFLRNAKVMRINPTINAVINEYKKARTPVKQKAAEMLTNTTTSAKKLFRSPFVPNRPSSCIRSSTSKKRDGTFGFSRASTANRPTPRAAYSLFPEVATNNDELSRTFEMPDNSSSPLAAVLIEPPVIGPKPASRFAQRLMSVDEVNQTISNQFRVYESHINEIKENFEKQMNELKQLLVSRDAFGQGNRAGVPPSFAPTQQKGNCDRHQIRDSQETHENGQETHENSHKNAQFIESFELPELSEYEEDDVYPANDENQAPNDAAQPVRRSTRISAQAMRQPLVLESSDTMLVPRRSKKSNTFEQKLMNAATLPQAEAIRENARIILDVLNRGDVKQLQKLSTIGPKTALKIWQHRNLKRTSFDSIESLKTAPFWTKTAYDQFIRGNNLDE